jgi:uncharacterized membrane protein YccC
MTVAGAMALLIGRAIDPVRYYWALIAAFVCFTGTTTVAETTRKGAARAGGTLIGLMASVVFAERTAGHLVATFTVIILAIFLAFYLQPVSYAGMIFFITIMIGQLYTLLHSFSPGLLVLRLKETVAGATVGIAVSVLVLPTRTRTVARTARRELFAGLRDVLLIAAEHTDGRRDPAGLLRAARVVDLRMRQYVLVTAPLLSSHQVGTGARMRRFGGDFAMLATRSRALAQALAAAPAQRTLVLPLRVLAGVCACEQSIAALDGASHAGPAVRMASAFAGDLVNLLTASDTGPAGPRTSRRADAQSLPGRSATGSPQGA